MFEWLREQAHFTLWKKLRSLECEGRHPHSVLSNGTCDECYPIYSLLYPQGWQTYPGDVCEHGTYVGGCGRDWLCGPCELGDTYIPTRKDTLGLVMSAIRT